MVQNYFIIKTGTSTVRGPAKKTLHQQHFKLIAAWVKLGEAQQKMIHTLQPCLKSYSCSESHKASTWGFPILLLVSERSCLTLLPWLLKGTWQKEQRWQESLSWLLPYPVMVISEEGEVGNYRIKLRGLFSPMFHWQHLSTNTTPWLKAGVSTFLPRSAGTFAQGRWLEN